MSDKKTYLGEFEEIVLLAIMRLGENAYGVLIRHTIDKDAGRSTSVGAIYTTLERLEQKGLISSRQGEPTPERGGRAKRYYKVEGAGVQDLNEAEEIRARLRQGVSGGLQPSGRLI
jgi:DNA-binding PadR family transcriptional regulator